MKNSAIHLIRLADNTLVEVHSPSIHAGFFDSIHQNHSIYFKNDPSMDIASFGEAPLQTTHELAHPKSVSAKVEQLTALLLNTCQPIAATWQDANFATAVKQAELELGLSFDPMGNLYIAQSKS